MFQNDKTVIFWLKSINDLTPEQEERYQHYQSRYERAGYKVYPMELENFEDKLWSNAVVHIGGYGSPMHDCFDVFEMAEKNNSTPYGLDMTAPMPEFSYPVIKEDEKEDFVAEACVSIVGVGTKYFHKLYMLEDGKWNFVKTINRPSQHLPLFKNNTEAVEKGTAGQMVRVGFSKSFIVYRINESKDQKTGDTTKVLNFQYIV